MNSRPHQSNTRLLVALLALACLWGEVQAAPRIAEFQASNGDTIRDEDGDTSDWLEIQNPDSTPVDLAGYSLSVHPDKLTRWTFPSIIVPSGGHLLVWASKKNRRAAPFHTDFNLPAEGGYLWLLAPGGTTVVSSFAPYPPQLVDRSYGHSFAVTDDVRVAAGADCRWRVPTSTISGWQNVTHNDSVAGWVAAKTGIGYDTQSSPVNYVPLIGSGGSTQAAMFDGLRPSCYLRIPFTMASPQEVIRLTLRMKYDDGFAAWINGTRLNPPDAASTNCPSILSFSSQATATRSDTLAIAFTDFDITGQISTLVNGNNVLAIQGLNRPANSPDFLCIPELHLRRINLQSVVSTGFVASPSPGALNKDATFLGFVDAPDFSIKRGFYTAPQSLALTTKTPAAVIRYTTNGTAPTVDTGTPYSGPLIVDRSMAVRAGAFLNGWFPSAVKSHTFIMPQQVLQQPALPAGLPSTWGYVYNFFTGQLEPSVPVVADYSMDPAVVQSPSLAAEMLPALTQSLSVMALSGSVQEIFGLDGIYSNGRVITDLEIPASVEFFSLDGLEKFQEDAGLRVHGGDALIEHPKKPFRLYFRKKYGVGELNHPLFAGSPVTKFDVLQLRPGGHDGWAVPFGSGQNDLARHATYLRDRFLRDTELAMNRLSVRGRYLHLYINGLYWGIYDLHEVPNSDFYASHLGGAEEDWDAYEHPGTTEVFDTVDGQSLSLQNLLNQVRPASKLLTIAGYDQVRQTLDVDEFIDYMIVQIWAAQNDWMGPIYRGTGNSNASRFFNKNWQGARRARGTDPGLFRWLVWDDEITMGNSLTSHVFEMRVTDFDLTRVGTPSSVSGISGTPGPPAEIYYALRSNPAFRARFADRLQKHFFLNGALTQQNNLVRLEALESELHLPMILESARWGDVNSGNSEVVTFTRDEHWRSEVDWLKNVWMTTRNEIVLDQFQHIGLWPNLSAPILSRNGGRVRPGFPLSMTAPAGGIFYSLDGTDPMDTPGRQQVKLITTQSECRFKIAIADYPGAAWKNLLPPEDEPLWNQGVAALGQDTKAAPTYAPYLITKLTRFIGRACSIYVRIPFSITSAQLGSLSALRLRMQCDDGALISLNGGEFIPFNANAASPGFASCALTDRTEAQALAWQEIDLSPFIPQVIGSTSVPTNVLAIQVMNSSLTDPDILLAVELLATLEGPQLLADPAPSAIPFTGPVPLATNTNVKARAFDGVEWSPLTEAYFQVGAPAASGNLTISEFSYNPSDSSADNSSNFFSKDFEFIELLNISQSTVDLSGCAFVEGVQYHFANATKLAPGQRLVLTSNTAAFARRFPGVAVAGQFEAGTNLANNGERLALHSAAGPAIFDFTYLDTPPWPTAPDGSDFTMVLIHPEGNPDPADPMNWRPSVEETGTPLGGDADTFQAWAARQGAAGQLHSDMDGDGLALLLEYAMGLDPNAPDAPPLRLQLVPSPTGETELLVPELEYQRNLAADDVALTLETSADMAAWAKSTPALELQFIPLQGLQRILHYPAQAPSSVPKSYYRLRAQARQ